LPVLVDKTITCRDCGRTFPFTVREQEFYAEKGFNNEPSRCPECRAAFKARQNGGVAPAPNPNFARTERQTFPAICATCGKATQVPFEPRPDRPVYCRDCFVPRPHSPGGPSDRSTSSGPRPSYGQGPSFGSLGSSDRASSFGSERSRDRGAAYGSGGSRDRGAAYGNSAPTNRRAKTNQSYDRRTDWTTSYDNDSDSEDDDVSPSDRRSGRNRNS
jgi:CxxC-x17-CxxC domain-containing protein